MLTYITIIYTISQNKNLVLGAAWLYPSAHVFTIYALIRDSWILSCASPSVCCDMFVRLRFMKEIWSYRPLETGVLETPQRSLSPSWRNGGLD